MSYKRSSLMQERMEQNREAILQSARELIAQGGIKDAQIQAIAERAGVSSGLVYRYFDNKSQVLIEVLSEAIQHEVKILNHIAESDELTSKQKLDKAVTTFVKRAMNSPQLAYSLMFEPVDAELEHERFRSKQLIKQSMKEILAVGKINGEFGFEDLNTAALCVVGAMTFVV
ncbi:MAG: TetR/AcrR family transcriptional regulator, partial [Acinetobacter sp.]|nr:TetR/AcrR family transcriptional regulator [Acinetobacter sp.]